MSPKDSFSFFKALHRSCLTAEEERSIRRAISSKDSPSILARISATKVAVRSDEDVVAAIAVHIAGVEELKAELLVRSGAEDPGEVHLRGREVDRPGPSGSRPSLDVKDLPSAKIASTGEGGTQQTKADGNILDAVAVEIHCWSKVSDNYVEVGDASPDFDRPFLLDLCLNGQDPSSVFLKFLWGYSGSFASLRCYSAYGDTPFRIASGLAPCR